MKKNNVVVINDENLPINEAIENRRAPLFKEYSLVRKISNLLTFVIVILAVAGMFLVTQEGALLQAIGWVILFAGLAGMLAFQFFAKRKFNAHSQQYLNFVSDRLNKDAFDDPIFKNLNFTENKLEITDADKNGAYAETYRIVSRHLITGDYESLKFTFSEAAFFRKGDIIKGKKRKPDVTQFVGKYFDIINPIEVKNNVLFNIKGKEVVDQPNAVQGKKILLEEDNFVIYADKNIKYKEMLGEQFVGAVKKLATDEHLLNIIISVTQSHTYVFMSYDDAVISIPFDKPFNYDAYLGFKNQVKEVLNAVTLLGK